MSCEVECLHIMSPTRGSVPPMIRKQAVEVVLFVVATAFYLDDPEYCYHLQPYCR